MEKSEIESYVKAGEIAKKVKLYAREITKKGVKLIDIAEGIDAKILELGGGFAFPVNLSLNEYAAHYTPAPGDETVCEGILKIDIGVCFDGFIADTAFSMDLTDDGEFKEMIELNERVLENITEKITKTVEGGVDLRICDIGNEAQATLEMGDIKNKFAMIHSLCGHSLGKDKIHNGLTISNCRNSNNKVLDNHAFAVEPFVTTGVGDIFEGKGGGIYSLQSDIQVRDRDARKVLEFIKEEFGSRNFCARFLARAGFGKLRFILSMLVKQGILYEYPILIEKARAPVSQVENTFVISDGKVICTTKED